MKQECGKGCIKLILAITAIIIVVLVGLNFAKETMNKEKVKNLQADLLLVKGKVEVTKGNYSLNKDENPLKGFQLTQLPEEINISSFFEKNVIPQEEYEKFYLLNADSLNQMGLEELVNKYSGYFIVNYDNFEVVYSEGYENVNGLWCYRLTDLNKMPEVVNESLNNGEQSQVQAEEGAEGQVTENSSEGTEATQVETTENAQ